MGAASVASAACRAGEAAPRGLNRWDQAEELFLRFVGVFWSTCSFGKCRPAGPLTPREREPTAFESDDTIAHSWVFRAFSAWLCTYADVVHGFEVKGLEQLPKGEPVLFILPHSTHNVDIFVCLFKMQRLCGRFPRGLFHRGVMLIWGWLIRCFGGVSGKRDIALQLAKAGLDTACVPGGVEDVLHHLTGNGKSAYELCWESHNNPGVLRTGFGAVASELGAGFKIVPLFVENGEEMKCNVLFELWTMLRLDVVYGAAMRCMPGPLHWLLWQVSPSPSLYLALYLALALALSRSLALSLSLSRARAHAVRARALSCVCIYTLLLRSVSQSCSFEYI